MEDFERMTLENQRRSRGEITLLELGRHEDDLTPSEVMRKAADRQSGVQMLIVSALVLLFAGGLIVNAIWNLRAGCVSAFEGSLSVGLVALLTGVLLMADGRKEILR